MGKDLTELVFILDRSGSMGGLESDTIGGYNSMLEDQKSQEGDAIITTVLFDDKYELLHDRINIKGLGPITDREYFVRGTTALLDAIGKTINKIGNVQKHTAREERADKVMFVITTDGMENSSREYSYKRIKEMIEHQKSKFDWKFVFLGANMDAIEVARGMGISAGMATSFHSDKEGTRLNYKVVNEMVSEFRINNRVSPGWKDEIERDYKTRKKS